MDSSPRTQRSECRREPPARPHDRRAQGDVNGDHTVDLADLATLVSNFGTTGGATQGQGDLNGDHNVDLADLALLLNAFGTTCP
ncbi:MAG TPA: dockerin type I domain-containing protein [Pirellulaceae bacterium]|nr:dockerin type I domain-containing protein [Pirellulaceae bacterium]